MQQLVAQSTAIPRLSSDRDQNVTSLNNQSINFVDIIVLPILLLYGGDSTPILSRKDKVSAERAAQQSRVLNKITDHFSTIFMLAIATILLQDTLPRNCPVHQP
jgi:hypothetical protein